MSTNGSPTVVLVHGAFADASGFRGPYDELLGQNVRIDPGVHHFSSERMGATVTEVEGASHVVMISHPHEVAEVVMTAVHKCGG
jgi:hypothetical protein